MKEFDWKKQLPPPPPTAYFIKPKTRKSMPIFIDKSTITQSNLEKRDVAEQKEKAKIEPIKQDFPHKEPVKPDTRHRLFSSSKKLPSEYTTFWYPKNEPEKAIEITPPPTRSYPTYTPDSIIKHAPPVTTPTEQKPPATKLEKILSEEKPRASKLPVYSPELTKPEQVHPKVPPVAATAVFSKELGKSPATEPIVIEQYPTELRKLSSEKVQLKQPEPSVLPSDRVLLAEQTHQKTIPISSVKQVKPEHMETKKLEIKEVKPLPQEKYVSDKRKYEEEKIIPLKIEPSEQQRKRVFSEEKPEITQELPIRTMEPPFHHPEKKHEVEPIKDIKKHEDEMRAKQKLEMIKREEELKLQQMPTIMPEFQKESTERKVESKELKLMKEIPVAEKPVSKVQPLILMQEDVEIRPPEYIPEYDEPKYKFEQKIQPTSIQLPQIERMTEPYPPEYIPEYDDPNYKFEQKQQPSNIQFPKMTEPYPPEYIPEYDDPTYNREPKIEHIFIHPPEFHKIERMTEPYPPEYIPEYDNPEYFSETAPHIKQEGISALAPQPKQEVYPAGQFLQVSEKLSKKLEEKPKSHEIASSQYQPRAVHKEGGITEFIKERIFGKPKEKLEGQIKMASELPKPAEPIPQPVIRKTSEESKAGPKLIETKKQSKTPIHAVPLMTTLKKSDITFVPIPPQAYKSRPPSHS